MADEGIAKTVEKTVTTPLSWAKEKPWAFAVLIIVAGIIFVRMSGRIQQYAATKAAAGSQLWTRAARLLGVAAVIAIGLWAMDAWSVEGLINSLPMLAVAFPAADSVNLFDENGNLVSKLTPGSSIQERKFNFKAPREVWAGFPIRAKSVNFAVTSVLTQAASTAEEVPWDALHQICAGVDVRSPRFDMMARKEDLSGPVLKHMSEYISRGYDYSGDEVLADISSTAAAYTFTVYFSYAFEQRWAAKPEEFELFVGWLQGTQFSFWLNTATIFSDNGFSPGSTLAGTDVQIRASYRYGIGAVQGDVRGAYTVPPLVNHRVIKTPAQGQEDIPFIGLGGTGPANTAVGAGERIVAMGLLSDGLGLPGPGPLNTITEIGCEALGIMNTQNTDMFLMGKLPRMLPDGAFAELETLKSLQQGWPWTYSHAAGTGNPLAHDDLLIFPLVLPSLGNKVTKLPRLKGDLVVHARRSDALPTTGMHCLYVQSLRDIDPTYGQDLLKSAGITGTTTRSVSHDADAAVNAGQTSASSYVGLPQVIKGTK